MGVRKGFCVALVFSLFAGIGCGNQAAPTPTPEKSTTQAETKGQSAETKPEAEKAAALEAKPADSAAPAGAEKPNENAGDKAATNAGAKATGATSAAAPPAPEASAAASAVASAAAPAATPEPPAPPPVVSPKVAEAGFSLWMQSSGRYKAGQQGFVEVVLVPKGEFHCNQEYPYKMKLNAAPAGVTYPTAIVRSEGLSVSASRATMRVPFVAQNAGDAKVSGKFYFSVCTSEQCVIDNRDVAVTVKVE